MSHPGAMPSKRNAYDHSQRDLVCWTRDLDLAERLGVPRSTAKSWMRRGVRPVVTSTVLDDDAIHLRIRVLRLERRVQVLLAIAPPAPPAGPYGGVASGLEASSGCRAEGAPAEDVSRDAARSMRSAIALWKAWEVELRSRARCRRRTPSPLAL